MVHPKGLHPSDTSIWKRPRSFFNQADTKKHYYLGVADPLRT